VQKRDNSVDEQKYATPRAGIDVNGPEIDPDEKLDNGK
jgi:hypothetical protein